VATILLKTAMRQATKPGDLNTYSRKINSNFSVQSCESGEAAMRKICRISRAKDPSQNRNSYR